MSRKQATAEAWEEQAEVERADQAEQVEAEPVASSTPEGTVLGTMVVMGRVYTVKLPYQEGHVINKTEAAVLNQTLKENLRNNVVSQAKRSMELGKPAPTQDDVDAYQAEYSFGTRRGRGQIALDPVATEERKLCELCIKQALKDRGIKFSTVDTDKFQSMVNTLLGAGKFRSRAEEIVRQKQDSAALALDVSSLV